MRTAQPASFVESSSPRRQAEGRIAELARRQHGAVARPQLLRAGLSAAAIGRRVRSGTLRPMHRGVYQVGPVAPPRCREMAAVLAGGEAAALSHTSAAVLWGLLPVEFPVPIHVSVPDTGRARRPGIRFHRQVPWNAEERTVVDGIPVTTVARTLVDAAALLGRREIELAAATAERAGLISSAQLVALAGRYPHRPGIGMLREVLGREAGVDFTRSELERRCLVLLDRAGLPRPHLNVSFGPYELDGYWPDLSVAIELDGRAYHSGRARFEGDRRKDAWLRARGIEVIRLSWRQIARDPLRTAVQVGQALALAGWRRNALRTSASESAAGWGQAGAAGPIGAPAPF